MNPQPGLLVMLPFFGLAVYRREWSLYLFLVSIPAYRLYLFEAIAHPFNPPELFVLVLLGHYLREAVETGRLWLPRRTVVLWAIAFLGISIASVVWLILFPTDIAVHPYEHSGFGDKELVALELSRYHITQPLLRVFSVGAIVVLAWALSRAIQAGEIRTVIRLVVFSAMTTGIVGICYQVAILLDFQAFPQAFKWFGFTDMPDEPRRIGAFPRMYSLGGEPMRTAMNVLLAFGYTIPFLSSRKENSVFTRTESAVVCCILLVCLILSTSGSGIVGLALLTALLVVLAFATGVVSPNRALPYGTALALLVAIPGGVLTLLSPEVGEFVGHQWSKVTLSTRSGSTRLWFLDHAVGVFRQRPILGVGVGSHSAPSVFATVLAESGPFGVLSLVGLQASILLSFFRQKLIDSARDDLAAVGLFAGGTAVVGTQFLVHPVGALQYPWFWISLALPLAFMSHADTVSSSQ